MIMSASMTSTYSSLTSFLASQSMMATGLLYALHGDRGQRQVEPRAGWGPQRELAKPAHAAARLPRGGHACARCVAPAPVDVAVARVARVRRRHVRRHQVAVGRGQPLILLR